MSKWIASALVFVGLAGPQVRAADADAKALEAKLEKALAAYNKDDAKAFYDGWAASMKSITTEPVYDALYKTAAKKEVGEYTPKTLKFRAEGSVLTGDFLVVYFDAEFAKAKAGLVSVNFAKEDGEYRLMQMKLEKKP